MKNVLCFILMISCILGMFGCRSKDTALETSDFVNTSIQNAENWSEQDIISMFSCVKETEWEYIDCVLIPDFSGDCIGAVLFWDDKNETSNVAFFDEDGDYQQCGTSARLSATPDFTYRGDGEVTFQLETEEGTIYNYSIIISVDGNNVNFKAKDDLEK